MNENLPHAGKQVICVVVTEPYKQSHSWLCYIQPVLIQENNGWIIVEKKTFPNAKHLLVWKVPKEFQNVQPGKLIIARLESVMVNNSFTYKIEYCTEIGIDGFYELLRMDLDTDDLYNYDDLINRVPVILLHIPEEPVYIIDGMNRVFGPFRYEVQQYSPLTGCFVPTNHKKQVDCFILDDLEYFEKGQMFEFQVSLSDDSYRPDDNSPIIEYTLWHGHFPSEEGTIDMETNEEFFHRVNKLLPEILGSQLLEKLEKRTKNNEYLRFIAPEEQRRYIDILTSIECVIEDETAIGQELFARLLRHKSVREMLDAKVYEEATPLIAQEQQKARQEAKGILEEAEKKRSDLEQKNNEVEQEIFKLEEQKRQLWEEIEFKKLEFSEEQAPAMGRLEKLVADMTLLQPLLLPFAKNNDAPQEKEETRDSNASQESAVSHEEIFPFTCEPREGDPIEDWQIFIEKRLYPLLQHSEIDVSRDDVQKFHLTTIACRCVLVPSVKWASIYARASGGSFLLVPIQPNNYTVSTVMTPVLRDFWRTACSQPDRLFFLMFEGVNRTPGSAWFRPWSHVAAELTDRLVLDNETFLWPKNIRVFISFDNSNTAFEVDELFTSACGAFVEKSKSFALPEQISLLPEKGFISAECWTSWNSRGSASGIRNWEASLDWLHAVRSDIEHMERLLSKYMSSTSSEVAEKIRLVWPKTYTVKKGSKQ